MLDSLSLPLACAILLACCATVSAAGFDDLLARVQGAEGASPPPPELDARLAADTSDEAVEHRKRLIVESGAEAPANWKAPSGKHTFDVAACRLKLDPDDETAWAYLPRGMAFRGQGDTFGRSQLSRIVRQFEDHIPADLREPLREDIIDYDGYLKGGTENHVAMRRTAGLLLAEMYPDATYHHDLTGEQLIAQLLKYMRDYGHAIYETSMAEYLSPIYHAVNTAPWLNVTELADSAEARITARAVLDWMLLDHAVNSAHGVIMPPVQREKGYLHGTYQRSYATAPSQWTGWLYWGAGNTPRDEESFRQEKYVAAKPGGTWVRMHAVSDWTPHRVIRNIGAKRVALPYMLWQSRGDWPCVEWSHVNEFGRPHGAARGDGNPRYQLRSVYIARDYAIGCGYYTQNLEDPILRNHIPFGISWRTGDDENLLRFVHPYWYTARVNEEGQAPLGRDDWLGISPFMRMVHWENAAIVLCDIPEHDPFADQIPDRGSDKFYSERTPECIQELHFYAPATVDERIKEGGVVFLREGGVYLAIRPLAGEARWEDALWPGWWRLVIPGALTGAAVEVGDTEEFGSFETFRAKVLATQAALEDGVASFTTTRGHDLTLAFREGSWLPDATVNGASLDFDRWPTCESPWLTVRDRVLDANDGREGFTIDFTGDLPAYEYYEIADGRRHVTGREYAANGAIVRE